MGSDSRVRGPEKVVPALPLFNCLEDDILLGKEFEISDRKGVESHPSPHTRAFAEAELSREPSQVCPTPLTPFLHCAEGVICFVWERSFWDAKSVVKRDGKESTHHASTCRTAHLPAPHG